MHHCPERPRSEDVEELGFRPQRMVRWLGPRGLASTAFRLLLAGIFGLYSDKRELEEVFPDRFPEGPQPDYSKELDLWIDFIADLADGWKPTYTMARLLAMEGLRLEHEGQSYDTERGRLLVMGGDQVYPFATEEQYRNRLVGPFTAALPCAEEGQEPHLYAIPGNHDWYDGLTTFLRRFCQQRPVGGWQTVQSRSYFSVRLPRRWWLWGIDIQFDFYIDEPQLRFFRRAAKDLEEGDRIILCTAMPSWVHSSLESTEEAKRRVARNLEFFERDIVRKSKGRIFLSLSGDHHHYARYAARGGPQQRITSGGGGAFLYPTHQLKETLQWPDLEEPPKTTYDLASAYPDQRTSKRLGRGAIWGPFKNPTFGVLLGSVHVLFMWMILFALRGGNLEATVKGATFWQLALGLARNPVSLLTAIVLVLGLVVWAKAPDPLRLLRKGAMGVVHGAAHLALMLALLDVGSGALALDGFWFWLALAAVVFVGGAALGSVVMGVYLFLAQVILRTHDCEAFSSQHLIDYKSYVRLHIDRDGVLTLFPIKVERVVRNWRLRPEGRRDEPWFEPDRPLQPELNERPVTIDPR